MTAPPTLTWSTEPDHRAPSGKRYVLRSPTYAKHHFSPLCADDRLGVCSRHGPRKWRASFFIGYDSIWFEAGTPQAAMRALERELDKRSIGIFGEDAITFVKA